MGDDNEAKNYSYSLEVGGYGRKIIWQGVPRSIRDSHRKVRDSYDGLIIQRNMALFFSGGDRKELKLRVTGRIWKEQWIYNSLLQSLLLSLWIARVLSSPSLSRFEFWREAKYYQQQNFFAQVDVWTCLKCMRTSFRL